jgi:hypothetical protein
MSDPLACVIATALEAARELDQQRIREIVREELAAWKPATEAGWMTPPAAARSRGISVKRVRALMDAGAVLKRAKTPGEHPKWEISLASLDKALAGELPPAPTKPIDAKAWAADRAGRKART